MKNGFTLIELLVTIAIVAIVAILAVVVLASLGMHQKSSEDEATYCMRYADHYSAPLKCYKYFGITKSPK